MNLPVYIAKRYLFAKKSRNAINVISFVSVAGVTIGTMALIIVLSVFNGLETMVTSIFGTFDPDLKVTPLEGKTFVPDTASLRLLSKKNGVECYSLTLEENALLRYGDRENIATLKGVDENYACVTNIDSTIWDGEYILYDKNGKPYAILGTGIAEYLGIRVSFITPLSIHVPGKGAVNSMNPEEGLKRVYIYPSGIYEVEHTYDSKYMYLPLQFLRDLIETEDGVSSVEIKLTSGADPSELQDKVKELFPDQVVKNRYEQQEIFYKVMKSERLAIFMILTLIIIIASFNIMGSLTMLIIEKERDIEILKSLGADNNLIRKIFIFEGWLISIIGTVAGLFMGFIICWLQETYGLVKLQGDTLMLTSYPITMELLDFIVVPATVLLIGYVAAWYPVRYLTRKYLQKND